MKRTPINDQRDFTSDKSTSGTLPHASAHVSDPPKGRFLQIDNDFNDFNDELSHPHAVRISSTNLTRNYNEIYCMSCGTNNIIIDYTRFVNKIIIDVGIC